MRHTPFGKKRKDLRSLTEQTSGNDVWKRRTVDERSAPELQFFPLQGSLVFYI